VISIDPVDIVAETPVTVKEEEAEILGVPGDAVACTPVKA
jgi:hypothetical protein